MQTLYCKEISCYSTSNSFSCSKCASKTSHVEAVSVDGKNTKWLCQKCYKAKVQAGLRKSSW